MIWKQQRKWSKNFHFPTKCERARGKISSKRGILGSALNDAGHYQEGATSLTGWMYPTKNWLRQCCRWVLPSSFTTKGSSFTGCCWWPPPFPGSLVGPPPELFFSSSFSSQLPDGFAKVRRTSLCILKARVVVFILNSCCFRNGLCPDGLAVATLNLWRRAQATFALVLFLGLVSGTGPFYPTTQS